MAPITEFTAAQRIEALPELARRSGRKCPTRLCTEATAEAEIATLEALGELLYP